MPFKQAQSSQLYCIHDARDDNLKRIEIERVKERKRERAEGGERKEQ